MRIIKIIGLVFLLLGLNGCIVIGGFMDSILSDDNAEFFQKIGRKIDLDLLTSDNEKFANKKSAERNCQYLAEPKSACLRAKELAQEN